VVVEYEGFDAEGLRGKQSSRGQHELPAGAGVAIPDRRRRLRAGVPLGAGAGRNARRRRESRVVFAGDYSGSNFEATAALRADDAGPPLPKAVVMLRAWIDSIENRYRVAMVSFDSAP
jgi:hypothetical protein